MRLSILGCVLFFSWTSVGLADEVSSKVNDVDDSRKTLTIVQALDESLPNYQPPPTGVRGELIILCSRLTNPIISRWATAFQAIHPEAEIIVFVMFTRPDIPNLLGFFLKDLVAFRTFASKVTMAQTHGLLSLAWTGSK